MTARTSIIEGPRFHDASDHQPSSPLFPLILAAIAATTLVIGTVVVDAPQHVPATQTAAPAETTQPAQPDAVVAPPSTPPQVVVQSPADPYLLEAHPGDGVTHLARRAVARYIEEQHLTHAMTPAHRIYMEDVLKDHTAQRTLAPGDDVTFDPSLLERAATQAQALTPRELENLQQYVQRVAAFRS